MGPEVALVTDGYIRFFVTAGEPMQALSETRTHDSHVSCSPGSPPVSRPEPALAGLWNGNPRRYLRPSRAPNCQKTMLASAASSEANSSGALVPTLSTSMPPAIEPSTIDAWITAMNTPPTLSS
jgi:hypothetical protein